MAFRRDSKVETFQRQISALRHQLGGESDEYGSATSDRSPVPHRDPVLRNHFPDLDAIGMETRPPTREVPRLSGLDDSFSDEPAVPSVDLHTSVIAHSTSWNGDLESTGSLHVHGRVDGSLTARADIYVAEEAEVDATISAANVTIAGTVRGSIQCSNRFELLQQGRVSGDVRAPVVVIHDGAQMAGDISMATAKDVKPALSSMSAARAANGGD